MNRNAAAFVSMAAVAAAACAAAAALVLPRSAWAAGDITEDPLPFASVATREEVRADLMRREVLRDTDWGEQAFAGGLRHSGLTRAQTRNEYKTARGEVAALTGEDSGSAFFKQHPLAPPTGVMGGPSQ